MKKKNHLILFFVFFALIRIIGIGFNLHIIGAIPDENYYENVILNAYNNSTLNLHFYWYPSFFFYFNLFFIVIILFIFKICFIFLKVQDILGIFFQNNQFYIMRVFIRFFSSITGVGVIYFSYKIGKKIFNKKGLIYPLLLLIGLNYEFIIFSHIAKPDMLQTFLVQIAIYLSLLFYEKKGFCFFYSAIFFSSLAAGTKLLGGIVILVPIIFLLTLFNIKKDWLLILKHTFFAFILSVSTFVLTTPFIIFEFSKAKKVFLFYKNLSHQKHYFYLYFNTFIRFINIQKRLFTLPIFIGIVLSFIIFPYFFLKEKKIKQNILYLFFVMYMVSGFFLNFLDTRYYFPVFPIAIIIFILIFDFIISSLFKNKLLILFLWTFLLFSPIYKGLASVYVFFNKTTQEKSYVFLKRLPKDVVYAFEIMTGANHSSVAKGTFSLGKRNPKFYFDSMITFVIHNKNMYKMYFNYDPQGKFNPFIYHNYQQIFRNSVIMKKIRGYELDFINPPIDYRKLTDNRFISNSLIKIKASIINKSNYHFWVMCGNKLLIIIPPNKKKRVLKEFNVFYPKAKTMFLFTPLKYKKAKGKIFFKLDISLAYQHNNYTKKIEGVVYPNKPFIFSLEKEQNE